MPPHVDRYRADFERTRDIAYGQLKVESWLGHAAVLARSFYTCKQVRVRELTPTAAAASPASAAAADGAARAARPRAGRRGPRRVPSWPAARRPAHPLPPARPRPWRARPVPPPGR